ncbi:CDP-diacylglycerol--serine O-phosphatidyltransferase [Prolixibacteraceae bacterium JC049]|nr:CDP-diacylglycerol--serine O-phosphatidyltransferase [Prolixibacteraceae bacterium JC049]
MQAQAPKIWTIPNGITLLNVLCGFVGILAALYGHLFLAGVFMLLGAIFDFGDGLAARLLKSSSPAGKELDSLADMVTFSVLPGFISFQLMQLALFNGIRNPFQMEAHAVDWIFLSTSALIPLFSALRLAKFNVDTRQSESFIGLATPANALFFGSLGVIVFQSASVEVKEIILNAKQLVAFNILFSALLVSEINMFSFKFKNLSWRDNKVRFSFIAISVALLIGLNYLAIPVIIILYILLSGILHFYKK